MESNLEDMQKDYDIDRKDHLNIIYIDESEATEMVVPTLMSIIIAVIFTSVLFAQRDRFQEFTASTAKHINSDQITTRFK